MKHCLYTGSFKKSKTLLYLTLLTLPQITLADTTPEFSGALTVTRLMTNTDQVNDETIGVFDLDIEGTLPVGRWHIYVEGTTTSKSGKVTDTYGESYADAGAAVDRQGNGRIQISTAEYYVPLFGGELVAGLLYPSGFVESADWTNDETTLFISSSFVNIPTNGAPDYALGLGYNKALSDSLSINLLLSQAQGLSDLDAGYNTLFDELDDYFFSAELVWQYQELSVHLASWLSTLDQARFDTQTMDNNQGLNLSVAYQSPYGLLVARYGIANDRVSEAERFYGLSWQYQVDKFTFGLGTSKTEVSNILQASTALDDSNQTELYVKYHIIDSTSLTASWQKINHSGFAIADDNSVDPSPAIASVRVSYQF